ncbi:MAG: ribosome silencing factor [Clostridia bacterium]|nr:ribosome silencing factor [Clostridia bacterium]
MAARIAKDSKASNVVVMDLRDISYVTDYFVIGSGDSELQVQSIARKVKEIMDDSGMELMGLEGYNNARWVLLDYGNVLIHIFHKDARDLYNLERLWGDAVTLEYDSV